MGYRRSIPAENENPSPIFTAEDASIDGEAETGLELEAALSDISFLMVQPMIELEIAQVAGKKHRRRRGREYTL
jgi:hypothetical protein